MSLLGNLELLPEIRTKLLILIPVNLSAISFINSLKLVKLFIYVNFISLSVLLINFVEVQVKLERTDKEWEWNGLSILVRAYMRIIKSKGLIVCLSTKFVAKKCQLHMM